MLHVPQIKVPATYMRGGTSKGVFFNVTDLPGAAQVAGEARDRLVLRVIGSPDSYGKHIDGMGGATSSTSKVVIIAKSDRENYDIDYLFGQVSIDRAFVDWTGNCGNLTAAVGSFAITSGLVNLERIPENGVATVRIWQKNIAKTIIARVPITNGQVQETGNFELDGVAFPAAEVQIEFMSPVDAGEAMFPTGHPVDSLEVPGIGTLEVTMINAGIPTVFLNAEDIHYNGTELQEAINGDDRALQMFETIRACGAIKMGLIEDMEGAASHQHTPKVAFVAPPKDYRASGGNMVKAADIDLNVRALSMGRLHHAMMGTAAVAIGTAAAIPGTLVNRAVAVRDEHEFVTFGHPSGTFRVGAGVSESGGDWTVDKVVMSRSARVLMEGSVCVPGDCF